MINIGDVVIYGTNGVCRYNGTVKKKTALGMSEYYEFEALRDSGNKMYMPSSFSVDEKVRTALSRDDALAIVESVLKEETLEFDGDESRRVQLSAMLKSNNSADAVRVVKSLITLQKSRQKRGNKLHSADERMLRLAKRLVDDELAYSLEISPDDVENFIKSKLKY